MNKNLTIKNLLIFVSVAINLIILIGWLAGTVQHNALNQGRQEGATAIVQKAIQEKKLIISQDDKTYSFILTDGQKN